MSSNVIAFTARSARCKTANAQARAARRSNVIDFAAWIGRAIPRRTPNGVFFTTDVLAFPGETA